MPLLKSSLKARETLWTHAKQTQRHAHAHTSNNPPTFFILRVVQITVKFCIFVVLFFWHFFCESNTKIIIYRPAGIWE